MATYLVRRRAGDKLAARAKDQERTVHQFAQTRTGGVLTFTNVAQETPIQEIAAYDLAAGAEPKGTDQAQLHDPRRRAPDFPGPGRAQRLHPPAAIRRTSAPRSWPSPTARPSARATPRRAKLPAGPCPDPLRARRLARRRAALPLVRLRLGEHARRAGRRRHRPAGR